MINFKYVIEKMRKATESPNINTHENLLSTCTSYIPRKKEDIDRTLKSFNAFIEHEGLKKLSPR